MLIVKILGVIGLLTLLLLAEFVLELIAEAILGKTWHVAKILPTHAIRPRADANPVAAKAVYVLVGAILGAVSLLVFPERILPTWGPSGMSLLVAPLAGGLLMHRWGRYRERLGATTTHLATFTGGAVFALAAAGVRLIMGHF